MKKILLAILTLTLLVSCNETGTETPVIDINNKNANTDHVNKHAKRIEIPAIEEGELFLAHTTTVNGKENVTYSLVHNAERKHSRWTAFTFDPSNTLISSGLINRIKYYADLFLLLLSTNIKSGLDASAGIGAPWRKQCPSI